MATMDAVVEMLNTFSTTCPNIRLSQPLFIHLQIRLETYQAARPYQLQTKSRKPRQDILNSKF
jgi:hypothetical protein